MADNHEEYWRDLLRNTDNSASDGVSDETRVNDYHIDLDEILREIHMQQKTESTENNSFRAHTDALEDDQSSYTHVIPSEVKNIAKELENAQEKESAKREESDEDFDEYIPPAFFSRLKKEKSEKQAGASGGAYNAKEEGNEDYEEPDISEWQRIRLNRKKTGCLSGLMYFAFVVCVSLVLAVFGWNAAKDVCALSKDYLVTTVTVEDGFTLDSVASSLYSAGLIEYKPLFKLFGKISHAENNIKPGTYELNTTYDYRALITKMEGESKPLSIVRVTVPEGKTMEETFVLLAEKNVCTYDELSDAAANYDFEYDFLSSDTLGDPLRLEGYLFPDTYDFYENSDPETVIKKFLNNFDNKVTYDMYVRAQELGYSMQEIITVASLIEKEAANNSERSSIASVIYNRLHSSSYPYLQIDATVQYALPERKEQLTYSDLEVDSPYNTYKYQGLTPGPISNPGLASISAALSPADTDYYFYSLHVDGTHRFFSSADAFYSFKNSSEFGG